MLSINSLNLMTKNCHQKDLMQGSLQLKVSLKTIEPSVITSILKWNLVYASKALGEFCESIGSTSKSGKPRLCQSGLHHWSTLLRMLWISSWKLVYVQRSQFINKADNLGTLSYNENVLKVVDSEMYSLCNNIKVHSANIPRGYITRGLVSIKALILTGWHRLLSSAWDKSLTIRHYNPQYILTFIEKCEIWPPGEVRMHTLDGQVPRFHNGLFK